MRETYAASNVFPMRAIEHARQLERELAAVTKERDELAICHDTQRDRADAYMEMSDKLKSELAAVTAERDELLAGEVRTEGSAKTPEERAELEDGFRQRISSENAEGHTPAE